MAQHGNRHPDDLLSPGNAARQLTPDEIQTIATHTEEWIGNNAAMTGQWLHQLPPIPPQPAGRREWAASLPEHQRVMYEDLEATRAHLRTVVAAWNHENYRWLLDLLTQARPGDVERVVRKDLYDIRGAVERRLGGAVAAAIAEARV